MNARTKEERGDLLSKIAEHRAAMTTTRKSVELLNDKVSQEGAGIRGRLDAISNKVDATQVSIISMQSLGGQILYYRVEQLADVRSPTTNPTEHLTDTNSFTNFEYPIHKCPGEYKELHYEYFCHWEVHMLPTHWEYFADD